MDSRLQKIAGIVFSLMFIAVLAVINLTTLTLGTSANNQLGTTLSSSDSSLSIYDQGTVSGSSVTDLAKAPDKVSSTDLEIKVITKANASGQTYTSTNPYPLNTSPSSPDYINSTAQFSSVLDYNNNSVVTGITFTQK